MCGLFLGGCVLWSLRFEELAVGSGNETVRLGNE